MRAVNPETDSGTEARSRRGSPVATVGAVGGKPRPRASAAGPSLWGASDACGTPAAAPLPPVLPLLALPPVLPLLTLPPVLTKRLPLPDVSGADHPSARTSLPERRGRARSPSMVSIGVTPPSGSFAKLQA